MKKIILVLAGLTVMVITSSAQCNKNLELISSETSYLNAKYEVQKTQKENIKVYITNTQVTIIPNGDSSQELSGSIKEYNCKWSGSTDGKLIIKSELVDEGGDIKNATLTIESKNGKITLLAEVEERPDQKIKLVVDKMEVK